MKPIVDETSCRRHIQNFYMELELVKLEMTMLNNSSPKRIISVSYL